MFGAKWISIENYWPVLCCVATICAMEFYFSTSQTFSEIENVIVTPLKEGKLTKCAKYYVSAAVKLVYWL